MRILIFAISIFYSLQTFPATSSIASIKYDYSSQGSKLKRESTQSNGTVQTTHYIGAFEYEQIGTASPTLSMIHLPGGRAIPNANGLKYEYYLTDHLGNVRMVFDNNNGEARIVQQSHYYPFGMTQTLYDNASQNKYLYNGKEQQATGLIDFGWRQADPATGRWTSNDNLAELYGMNSPYTSVLNNPVNYIDPDGNWVKDKGDRYEVTGDDVYAYSSYLKNIGNGSGSVSNLQEALGAASKKNEGDGGNMPSTLSDEKAPAKSYQYNSNSVVDAMGQMYRNPNFDSKSPQYTAFREGSDLAADIVNSVLLLEGGLNLMAGGYRYFAMRSAQRAVTQGAVNVAANTGTKLLTQGAKALHKHHVLPQQFSKWFASRGINNIDDYAVQISESTHLKGVHGKGLGNLPGQWNQLWGNFINANPNATPSQIFHHAEGLLQRFGLEHLPYVPY